VGVRSLPEVRIRLAYLIAVTEWLPQAPVAPPDSRTPLKHLQKPGIFNHHFLDNRRAVQAPMRMGANSYMSFELPKFSDRSEPSRPKESNDEINLKSNDGPTFPPIVKGKP
jgi:hypothetical protein